MAAGTAYRPKNLPPELTQRVELWFHPELYLELKIASLRAGKISPSEFLHGLVAREIDRPELTLEALRKAPSGADEVARDLASDDEGVDPESHIMDDGFPEALPPAKRGRPTNAEKAARARRGVTSRRSK